MSTTGAEPRRIRIGSPQSRGAIASRRILGMRVDALTYPRATAQILAWAQAAQSRYVCVATVHMVMEAYDDPAFQRLVNAADLITSDGMPLVWGLRRLGCPEAQRVYGPDLTLALCAAAERAGLPVGFYGGRDEVLADLVAALQVRFPALRVVYRHSPPFRAPTPDEEAAELAAIRASGCRLLFVGLGCPKQERWMAAHIDQLEMVLVGVGAAFDFLAGAKRTAPRSLQALGLEWLFRLACEPRRLARRYLYHNPRFVVLFGRQLVRH